MNLSLLLAGITLSFMVLPMRLGLEAGEHTHALATELGIKGVPISAEQLVKQWQFH